MDLRGEGLTESWRRAPVADLISSGKLVIGDGYRAKNEELSDVGLPFARAKNVNDGFHFDDADYIPESGIRRVGNKVSVPGDVVFTSKGTVGRFALVRPETPRFVYSPQLCFWRVLDRSLIDPGYLFYWMSSREFYVQYKGVAGQTDMAEYVSLSDQRSMYLTLPEIDEQRAIAHILGTLDDKIELNRRMNETLEGIARALFKSWFVNFEPVHAKAEGREPFGMDAETAALFLDSFEDSELGPIPQRWRVGSISDVAENVRRQVRPQDISPATPYIGLEHMPKRNIALSEWGTADGLESNKFSFQRGEILFGKLRPYFHKVGVAPVDGVASTDIVVVRPRSPEWFGFLLGHISSDQFVEYTSAGSTGTRMPRTNWEDMARFRAAIPPARVAYAYNVRINAIALRIIEAIHQSHTTAEIRDALLPRLVSGQYAFTEPSNSSGTRTDG